MANTLKLGNGNWAKKEGSLLSYNDENNNFKPLPFDFARNSVATVINKKGLIETVASGLPRIDFKDDSKGVLLLEPSKTNLIPYSENFNVSDWAKLGTAFTITSNNTISPSGELNASSINATNNDNILYKAVSGLSSSQSEWNFSLYAKGSGSFDMNIRLNSSAISTVTKTLTNEWQRFDVSVTGTPTITSIECFIELNVLSTYEVWGAQLEESYATSYIPTNGATATRVLDACNNGGNNQVFNDSEGVLYTEIKALSNDGTSRVITIGDGSAANRVFIKYDSTINSIQGVIVSSGVAVAIMSFTTENVLQFNKIALRWSINNFSLWLNGVAVVVDSAGGTPTGLNKLFFDSGVGSNLFNGKIKDLKVYNSALTNEEMQTLTTI